MSYGRNLRSVVIVGGWPSASRSWEYGGRPYADKVAASKRANTSTTASLLVQQPTSDFSTSITMSQDDRTLTVDNVFSNLRRMEYAVRGPLLMRAIEIEKELKKVRSQDFTFGKF